jgi:signal transduction histidine kinase
MVKGASAVLSRARKTRGLPRAVGAGEIGTSPAVGGPVTPADSPIEAFSQPRDGGQSPDGGQQPAIRSASGLRSRRALKNWRVRSRLLLLVVIPTVTAVAAGGIFIGSSVQNALVYQRVLTLANLSGKITGLVQALQNERKDTVQYIVLGHDGGGRGAPSSSQIFTPPTFEVALLSQDYGVTTGWANQVEALAGGINGSYSTLAQQDTQAAITAIGNLSAIRDAATGTDIPAQNIIDEYASTISALLALESQISVGSSDSTLAGSVTALGLVSNMKEEASQQQALLISALESDLVTLGPFGPALQSSLTDAQAQQQGDLNQFNTEATADQRQLFNNTVTQANVVQAEAQEQQAISLAASQSPIATDPTISDASSSLSFVVNGMRSVEQQLMGSVIARSGSLRQSAITSAILFTIAVALLLGIALTATIFVGRSMVRPLRKLRSGALAVAEERLPEMVRRITATDGEGVPLEVEPIDVDSSDEIGEVARAFDQVHSEAVRLAANEAALRGNVNAMFVNLSRRSQSLVERQIRVITRLEQGEQDSKRLASLFLMDHLATRMRRNSENLLVLAGHELSRRWSRPVALVDVVRAAVSEIENYERVTLNVQVSVSVRTEAVSDVVHLTAELVENATSYSAEKTPVTIAAYLPGTGGALIEITDQGVGMAPEELAHANWRLDNPPVVDVAVSRRMGLFVVARLAARHGIRIRLRPASPRGLIALIWLPDETITPEKSGQGPLRPAPENRAVGANGGTDPGTRNGDKFSSPRDASNGWEDFAAAPTTPPLPVRGRADRAGAAGHPSLPGTQLPGPQFPGTQLPGTQLPGTQLPGMQPWAEDSQTETGPLPSLGDRLRASRLGVGPRPRDAESGHAAQGPEPGAGPGSRDVEFGRDGAAAPVGFPGAGPGALPGAEAGQHFGTDGWSADWNAPAVEVPPPAQVTIPPAANPSEHDRLPIFEAVESHWFRHGRQPIGRFDQPSESWSSPADDGWRAAQAVHAPAAEGTTQSGLPKRVPRANLVPGTASAPAATAASARPAPSRSAADAAGRYASYQRGVQQGRAAATEGNPDSEEGTTA